MLASPHRRSLLVTICLLTAACAAPLPRPAAPRSRPGHVSGFALEGRISVRHAQTSYSADIAWHHAPEQDQILLSGPLGQGLAELVRDASGARLKTADRREYAANDIEQLSTQVFGFTLPLSGMAHWIVGDAAGTQRDAIGRAEHLAVDGWSIDYLDWTTADAEAMPQLINMRRDDLEVRLKITEWQDLQ